MKISMFAGSYVVRSNEELAGCSDLQPERPNSALFRIEVISPLNSPEDAAIVSSPRIFEDLQAPPTHGLAPADVAAIEAAKAAPYTVILGGAERVLPGRYVQDYLSIVQQRGGEGAPTADDSSTLRNNIQTMVDAMFGGGNDDVTAEEDLINVMILLYTLN